MQEYLSRYPKDNSDLSTLLYAIGEDAFFEALQKADGRRIIHYHDPEDLDKDDPTILWKYAAL